jgi:flagellum-specific ATP synthase
MPLASLKDKLASKNFSVAFGEVVKINATLITAKGLNVSISDMVKIISNDTALETTGMVTEIDGDVFFITPFSFVEGFRCGDRVFLDATGLNIPVGRSLFWVE